MQSPARLVPLLALFACAAPHAQEGRAAPERRPNVLVLFADDQRGDAIGAWADGVLATPNMDRLAAEGFAFRRAYVAGSVHGAVCMPSRAMLHTGRHFDELPLTMTSLWSGSAETRGQCEFPTMFETFDDAGYETFATGKWHNGPASLRRGLDGGGAIMFGGMSNHAAVPIHDFDPTGAYPAAAERVGEKFSSELFADQAVAFLEGRTPRENEDDPFFLYVSFSAPHDPRMAPEPWSGAHDARAIPLPANFRSDHEFPIGDLAVRDEELAPHPRTPEVIREHIAGYWAMIEHLDGQVGRVLAALEASGHGDDTIVVYCADNGLAVGQHGLLGKQNLYEHSSGVPLVLGGPGIEPGSSEALVYLHDLFPTLCDLTGVAAPDTITAHSLAPILDGRADLVRERLLLSYQTSAADVATTSYQRALVTPRWKYLRSLHEGHDVTRLFDLAHDPWELADRSTDPELTPLLAGFAEALEAELDAVGDPASPATPGWGFPAE